MKWPVSRLKQLADFDPTPPRKQLLEANPLVAFMPMASVDSESSVATTELNRSASEVLTGYTYFQTEDVLVAKITPCFENGKIAIANIPQECGFGTTEFHVIRVKRELLDAKYLTHFLRRPWIIAEGERKMTGSAGQRRVPRHFLEGLEIPSPPIQEQRRIAAILDKAEALRAKRRQALAKLDTLTQSLFLGMFHDLQSQTFPLGSIADAVDSSPNSIRTGPFGSQLLHSEFIESGIPVLGIDNAVTNRFMWAAPRHISEAKYNSLRRYTVKPGDVLITIMGTCGRTVVVPNDIPVAINTKHLCCITVDRHKYVPEFIQSCILMYPASKQHLLQTSKGAIMSGLNMELIKSTPIPKPPLELQILYRDRKAKIETMRANYLKAERVTGSSFTSLQHQAFRGEL